VKHIAIIGSGPAGYYTAEAAQKQWGDGVMVDVFDRLPVPFGLIRTGVAPDHQSIKGVSKRYEAVAQSDNVRFLGNVTVGEHVTIAELEGLYDAVILATGAPHDKKLGMEGEDLSGVYGSAAFVGWYNGHPQFATLDPDVSGTSAVVIGNGNVALDVARILAKTRAEFAGSDIVAHALDILETSHIEQITILGRRGPHQIAMTTKELGELAHLERACPRVDPADLPEEGEDALLEPGQRKSVTHLRSFAAIPESHRADKDIEIDFDFFASPKRMIGEGSKVTGVEVERTKLDGGRAVGTGETYVVPASLVVCCIGYQTSPIPGVPFEESAGRFANVDGRILPGLYCVGWARRGPSGTIGTNRPDGFSVIERVVEDMASGEISGARQGGEGFDALAKARGIEPVRFRDWKKIEEAETKRARHDAPREKFVHVDHMIEAAKG
jgi:ferredoxin--NADP+ reductase